MADYEKLVQKAREIFNTHKTKSYEFRVLQLKALGKLLEENEELFAEALKKDIGKPYTESVLMEVGFMGNDILNTLYNLKDWMKPEKVDSTIMTLLDKSHIQREPLGVVLIIGAWNYPVTLTLHPLVGAIAAGNCAVLKPSELAPTTAKLFSDLIPRYLDADCYPVVLGGATETTELLKSKFDHIFYTGSVKVGRLIYEAAAKQLTPVTLEMGGKCPVYMDDTVRFDYATKRIMWGKCINSGQTCVAPDYLMCSKEVEEQFLKHANSYLREWYGDNPKNSPDLARIVNRNHFDRLINLMSSGTIAIGGDHDVEELYIAPTVLTNVKPTDPIMQEEIFGPILPIITIGSLDEAIDFINKRPKPLSAYLFSAKCAVKKQFLNLTSSGGAVANDTALHLSVETLPFGGVGESGIGNYHGKFSFEVFSHKKAVLTRDYFTLGEKLSEARYPPYTEKKLNLAKTILKKRRPIKLPWLPYAFTFLLGICVAIGIHFALEHFAS